MMLGGAGLWTNMSRDGECLWLTPTKLLEKMLYRWIPGITAPFVIPSAHHCHQLHLQLYFSIYFFIGCQTPRRAQWMLGATPVLCTLLRVDTF